MHFEYAIGATPLDQNEIEGLIPIHITTQAELNEFEQENILQAETWVTAKQLLYEKILDTVFIKKLHQKMFNLTWRWAGKFRLREKNIGVDPFTIGINIKNLLDDVIFQINNQSYSIDEISARFHHRLVSIHPFANGNGRHARLMTDMLLKSLEKPRFSWGMNSLDKDNKIRKCYIDALKAADKHQYGLLLNFVRS